MNSKIKIGAMRYIEIVSRMWFLMTFSLFGCSDGLNLTGIITTESQETLVSEAVITVNLWEYQRDLADSSALKVGESVIHGPAVFPIPFEITPSNLKDRSSFGYYVTVLIDSNGNGQDDSGDYNTAHFNKVFETGFSGKTTIEVIKRQ